MFKTMQKILLVKEESEYGTDPTPTLAANAVDAESIVVNYVGEVLERALQRETMSPPGAKLGKRSIEVSFSCELKGSGSLGVAPALGDLLEACGFAESVDAGSSVVYAPASTGHKSVTIYVYDVQVDTGNWRLHKITGARGNVNVVMEAGQIARLDFTLKGKYNAMTDVSDPGSATYEETDGPVVESSAFTLNSVSTLVVQSVNVDMGNDVQERPDINTAGGIKGFVIGKRRPQGSFNPEAVLAATYDFRGDWAAATERALSVVAGSVAGNKITITAPKVTIDGINEEDRNGVRVDTMPFKCGKDSGDDELVLTFE